MGAIMNSRSCAILVIAVIIMFGTAAEGQLIPSLLSGITTLLNSLIPGILSGSPVPIANVPALNPVLPLIQTVNAGGVLCCTPTGNCVAGSPPLSGVLVSLNCSTATGGSALLGQNRTNSNGLFTIVGNVLGTNILPLRCNISVALPVDQLLCPALSTVNGTLGTVNQLLTGILTPVDLLLRQILGLVLNLRLSVGALVRI